MPKRIVVVDDEPDIRTMLDISLKNQGYEVQLASDGVEGLELIRKTRPDLAILDVKMPRMNGFELLVAMRNDAQLKDMPVVMLTSLTVGTGKSDELWRQSLEITDFLSKPFDTQELLSRVNRILEKPAE
ncbi:MAG: response regulator [Candidatus Sumerlaeaceae bacterium]